MSSDTQRLRDYLDHILLAIQRIEIYTKDANKPGSPPVARELGASLGKVNYCVNALIEKGWVKARNFRNSNHKLAYAYLLTPRGIGQKAAITVRFPRRKMAEYESLKKEIAQLRREVAQGAPSNGKP